MTCCSAIDMLESVGVLPIFFQRSSLLALALFVESTGADSLRTAHRAFTIYLTVYLWKPIHAHLNAKHRHQWYTERRAFGGENKWLLYGHKGHEIWPQRILHTEQRA